MTPARDPLHARSHVGTRARRAFRARATTAAHDFASGRAER